MGDLLNNLGEYLLWGSAIYFWIFVSIFVITLFISDIYENGHYAFVSFIIFICVINFKSNLDLRYYLSWELPLIYLGIGFGYSLIRTYFYGRKPFKPSYVDKDTSPDKLKKLKREKLKSKLKNNVFRWWFLFPVSFLNWLFSDLLKEVYTFVYDKISWLFESILDLGINSVSQKEKNK